MHRRNAAERAIITFNNHFVLVLSTTDPYFPIRNWYQLLSQFFITLNLLLNSGVNPALSVYAYLYGRYYFNKYPMLPPGTRIIVHNKPVNLKSWCHHVTPGWYIGPALDHYRSMQCYMPATGIVRITDTLQYIPNAFALPKTLIEVNLQQSIGYIVSIIKDPPKTLPFLSYGDATKNVINKISRILQRSTARPCLQILPFPPILPQSQNKNIVPPKITSNPAPAPRVEPSAQPPRV